MARSTTRTLRSPRDLATAGLVAQDRIPALEPVARSFGIAVTPAIAGLVDPDDADDPIARQFIPAPEELAIDGSELADPIGDDPHSPVEGIVHRYPDRVLLKPIHICPVYCRFCFRREKVGDGEKMLDAAALDRALAYIESDPAIWEVILSGGDPLMLGSARLSGILERIGRIAHVGTIRIHTRVPIASPERVGDALVEALRKPRPKPVWIAVHANHAREFGEDQRAAVARLADAGIPLVGQSVLLRGVNDDAESLKHLFRTMIANRIKPYYLHHPDLARGTGHFRLGIDEGRTLVDGLRGNLSGLALPTYVLDIPGGHGKVPLGSAWAERHACEDEWSVRDPAGSIHAYPPGKR